jgi:hypothetical protein
LFKRTEVLLNRAIGYVAAALDWVITQVGGFMCKPNPYAGDNLSNLSRGAFESIAADIVFKGFFKAMTYIGSFAAVYAIPLSSKVLKYKALNFNFF